MRQPEHSSEAIIRAGVDIAAEGKRVTKFAIRGRLQGGNTTRIEKIWNEYVQSFPQSNSKPAPELSFEVSESMEEAIRLSSDQWRSLTKEINRVAVQDAEVRINEAYRLVEVSKKEHADAIHDAEIELDMADKNLFDALEREQALREQLNRALENASMLRETSAQQAGQIVELKAELVTLHAKLTPLQI